MDFKSIIAEKIAMSLESAYDNHDLSAEQIAQVIEIPPDTAMGDYAFPCFRLSKSLRKAPPVIADALKQNIDMALLQEVQSVKG